MRSEVALASFVTLEMVDGHAIICRLAQLIFRAMWLFRPQAIVEVAPVRAGDATLLHPLTVHAATENSSAMPRYISRFGALLNRNLRHAACWAADAPICRRGCLRPLHESSFQIH